jgi:hypothetical protein
MISRSPSLRILDEPDVTVRQRKRILFAYVATHALLDPPSTVTALNLVSGGASLV